MRKEKIVRRRKHDFHTFKTPIILYITEDKLADKRTSPGYQPNGIKSSFSI